MLDLSQTALTFAFAIFAIGGFTKGVLGVGLPMVVLPLVSIFAPIPEVVAIMYFSILASNLWQALRGGQMVAAFKRFWPLLLVLSCTVWAGTFSLVRLDQTVVATILGLAIATFSAISLASPRFRIPQRLARPLGLCAGAGGGFFGGMALIGGPPVIMYFVALHLKKEEFIGSIGLVYLMTLIPAGFAFVHFGVLETRHVVPGLVSLVPTFAGLMVGQWVRGRINQDRFRKILLGTMILIGFNLIRRGLF